MSEVFVPRQFRGPPVTANGGYICDGYSRATGKIAMVTLLVTGILVLWLKWNWVIPNVWFWAKMGFIVLMLVFISLNEMTTKRAQPGDPEAARRSKMFGQLTALSFLGVVVTAVFAFN